MEEYPDYFIADVIENPTVEQIAGELIAVSLFVRNRVAAGTYPTMPPAVEEILQLNDGSNDEMHKRIRQWRPTGQQLESYIYHRLIGPSM